MVPPTMAPPIDVRIAGPADAPALIELQRQIALETTFMLLEPGEIPAAPDRLAAHLADAELRDNAAWFIAEEGDAVAGFLGADGGRVARNRATARIFLGVVRASWGRGVARALFRAVEDWAPTRGIRRLDLTVQAGNERARALYQRLGYEIEGCMRQSLVVDGEPVDEILMAKLL